MATSQVYTPNKYGAAYHQKSSVKETAQLAVQVEVALDDSAQAGSLEHCEILGVYTPALDRQEEKVFMSRMGPNGMDWTGNQTREASAACQWTQPNQYQT